jgi:hypothetical protein
MKVTAAVGSVGDSLGVHKTVETGACTVVAEGFVAAVFQIDTAAEFGGVPPWNIAGAEYGNHAAQENVVVEAADSENSSDCSLKARQHAVEAQALLMAVLGQLDAFARQNLATGKNCD